PKALPDLLGQRGGGGADIGFELRDIEGADRIAVDARLSQAELDGKGEQVDPFLAAPALDLHRPRRVPVVAPAARGLASGDVDAGQQAPEDRPSVHDARACFDSG